MLANRLPLVLKKRYLEYNRLCLCLLYGRGQRVLSTLLWNQNGCHEREGYVFYFRFKTLLERSVVQVQHLHCKWKFQKAVRLLCRLAEYSESCVKLAKKLSDAEGSVLYTPTWRASPDWAERLSMSKEEVQSLIGFSYTIRNSEECHYKQ